ncbi:MAG: hypothetical protein PVH61_21820 [Candidatus Aminicenantes bacterium]|jgi:hypothetical protein
MSNEVGLRLKELRQKFIIQGTRRKKMAVILRFLRFSLEDVFQNSG